MQKITRIFFLSLLIINFCHLAFAMKDELEIENFIPTGSVICFAGTTAPQGWLMCDGQIVSRIEFKKLYDVIGRTYTPINYNLPISESLFCVPDMRGRTSVGVDNSAIRVKTNNSIGASGGEENVILAINNIPTHDHIVKCSPQTQLGGPYPGDILVPDGSPGATQNKHTNSTGDGQPHNNMQPYLILNYIIKY